MDPAAKGERTKRVWPISTTYSSTTDPKAEPLVANGYMSPSGLLRAFDLELEGEKRLRVDSHGPER